MAVIPRDVLLHQAARIRPPFDRAGFEARSLENLKASLPDWDPDRDEILRRSLPLLSELGFILVEMAIEAVDASLLPRAIGDDLLDIGIDRGVLPPVGIASDDYRQLIADSSGREIPVILDDYRAAVIRYDPTIVDVQAVRQADSPSIVLVYVLRSDDEPLSDEERVALGAHFTSERNKMANLTSVSSPAVVLDIYSLTMTVHHESGLSGEGIETTIRDNIANWVSSDQRIGAGVFRSKILGLVTSVEGVTRAEITAPANDLAAVPGTLHQLSLPAGLEITMVAE